MPAPGRPPPPGTNAGVAAAGLEAVGALRLERASSFGLCRGAQAIAYEPVQKLLAVGSKDGDIQLFGQHGAVWAWTHEQPEDVTQLFFGVNNVRHCGSLLHAAPPACRVPIMPRQVTLPPVCFGGAASVRGTGVVASALRLDALNHHDRRRHGC